MRTHTTSSPVGVGVGIGSATLIEVSARRNQVLGSIQSYPTWSNINQAENPSYPWPTERGGNVVNKPDTPETIDDYNGLCFIRSEIRIAQVTDGTSNTYLIGEKFLRPQSYGGVGASSDDTTYTWGDNETIFTGFNRDYQRSGLDPPLQDRSGGQFPDIFGSAHPGVMNMSMCDGSVRAINYDIDPATHRILAIRDDGRVIGN